MCDRYFWPTRRKDVDKYVRYCDVCQRHKARRHCPYSALQSLEILAATEVLKHFFIDFVTGLLLAQNCYSKVVDAILVIVDRLSKLTLYLDVPKTINARLLADVVKQLLLTKYSVLKSIVTDRGTLFTSNFWAALLRQ